MSYSNFAPWWCVKDSSTVFFNIVLLGLPVVIGITLISLCFSFLCHYARQSVSSGQTYPEYWTGYMKQAGDFHIEVITSVHQFSHGHLWFISLLLCFFAIFAGVAYTRKGHQASGTISCLKNTSGKSILVMVLSRPLGV